MPTNVLVLNKSWLVTGAGAPEGVHAAPVGSLYMREDGAAGTCLYVKEMGADTTGWKALGADLLVSAAALLLGRGSSSAGPMQEIVLGSGLTMSGTVLDAPRSSTLVNYSYSNTTTEPPAAAQARLNAVYPWTAATKLWVRTVSADGQDVYWGLMVIEQGMTILLQDKDDHTLYVRLTATDAPVDKGTYVEIPVAHYAHGGAITNNAPVLLQRSGGGTGASAFDVEVAKLQAQVALLEVRLASVERRRRNQ